MGLLITTVVPILLIGAVSYYMIYLILDNKTVKGIESTLYQVRTTLEKTYNNLNYVSQQYAARDTQLLLESDEPVEKYILGQQVFARLQLLSFTNPDTNVVYIYTPGSHDVFYENQPIRPDSTPERLPVLTTYKGVTLYAPHATFGYGSGFVFSMSRSVNLIKGTGRSLYVETSTDVYDQLMNDRQFGIKTVQVLTDSSGFVVFSQDEAFPPGSRLPVDRDNKAYQIAGDHYYFQEYSQEQGWYVYSIIHKTDFRQEVQSWTIAWAAIAALSLLVSAAVGWWIWNMFYFPLRKLNKEIRYLGDSRYEDENQMQRDIRLTQIAEFDVLLTQFQDMRSNIWSLLTELKRQEEDKRHLEVEKLVAQINPHFLYNTLNTVQWLAKTKGEEEIVSLVTVFIRLLRYNLGKDGGRVKLRQEIDALNDYVALQQIRYNYEFTVDIQADPRSLDVPVPRFLLQPLIENALYHGLTEEDSAIELTITIDQERYLLVQVKDNGRGMSQEELQRLMQHKVPERDQVGMGIGLSYVNAMLLAHFGQASQLQASSSREEGTTMYFRIPVDDKQGGGDESSIDR
ncbi:MULTISPECIES: sensor histidine kinase [unclassified Paenibacillus]|uniref:sensor histidine kinase n=1 Tax=unclassified Paenibacillus TaxID=185978 RepID=UPI0015A0990A|nr:MULTISPECIES: histidine kinase [unclassified Paenibacillus]